MPYKTILIHVNESNHTAARVRIAARIAQQEGAHLIGAAMTGVSRYLYESGALDKNDPNLVAHLDMLRQRGERALAEFEAIVTQAGVPSYEKRLVDDEAGAGMATQASYADLVVLGQNDPDETLPTITHDFPEYVLLNCGRPLLLVPYAGRFENAGQNALIAWDASIAATRAVSNALPLLQRARIVHVAVFNAAEQPHRHGAEPGADIALYLARHGVNVAVNQQSADIDVGNALLSLATDLGSDLIVMGGYVHSRFRELLLGGVTRTILDTMTVPVLMAH
jgi:nucleotide-binding universal stress UspA family protein